MSTFADLADLQAHASKMTGAERARAARRRPARTITITPEMFAEDWASRPIAAFEVGLRVPSEADTRNIEVEAEKAAEAEEGDAETKVGAYNRTLFALCVSRGLCDPKNVTDPHPFFELPEEVVPYAFKPRSLRWLFDNIELLAVEQSPLFEEATADEARALAEVLTDGRFERLSARAKRYLRMALNEI